MSEGAASLANSKAQWASALQSSLLTFRVLCSPAQATSKSWKPVLPVGAGTGSTGTAGASSSSASQAAVAAAAAAAASAASSSLEPAAGASLMTPSVSARSISSNHAGIPWRSATPSRLSTPRSADTALSSSLDSMFASQASSSPSTSTLHQSPSMPASSSSAAIAPSGPFVLHPLDATAVTVHRRAGGKALGMSSSTDVFRATAEVAFDGVPDLQGFRGVLTSPECRCVWDGIVEEAEVMELLEPHTRITKTNFKLGWPANPRDAITISQTLSDGATLLDISTSLPRSPDAPAYLRPAPPYVRSNVNLYAWCIQLPAAFTGSAEATRPLSSTGKQTLRITLFWSWDLRGAWLGMPAGGLGGQLPHVLSSLVGHVRDSAARIPVLCDYGTSLEVLSRTLDPTRDTLHTAYQVLSEDEAARAAQEDAEKDPERLLRLKARRALQTCAEWSLPADEGWDVHVEVKAQNLAAGSSAEWKASASRAREATDAAARHVVLRLRHAPLERAEESVRVKVTVQRIAASSEIRLRVNDQAFAIEEVDVPAALDAGAGLAGVTGPQAAAVMDDAASISGFSTRSVSTRASSGSLRDQSDAQTRSGTPSQAASGAGAAPQRAPPDKSAAIAALVRRNYIYFTSLLQEPDAKWRRISDGRGVTVTQLDSIDPTLVVYRAEATFVGVGVWDLFSTIATPGAQIAWDKTIEDAQWLEDAGEASRLMWTKTKAAWPVSARDAVMVETSYKSPSSVHVFSFSTDDRNFFPAIPPPQTGTIRTQVDLRGWSIEALSPTTVHITLIEQSDPRGWTSKSATPAAMTTAVAGVGEYAIKSGGPPIATRLLGARTKVARYDHEKSTYRLEYDLASGAGAGFGPEAAQVASPNLDASNVECELRCDVEMWSAGLDLVVDPPPINVSCLRRHKLSQGGSGMWLTIEHVPASLEDDTARVIVRKAHSAKEKGVVLVNGARIRVDVDQLKEGEAAQLRDRKRVKPRRVPLDIMAPKPPHKLGEDASSASPADPGTAVFVPRAGTPSQPDADGRKSSAGTTADTPAPSSNIFSDERPRQPMTCALDVLFLLRRIHAERSPDPAGTPAGWALVSQRNGLYVRRKQMHSISSTVVVQRGDKVVEGLTAEDICTAVSTLGCRRLWDERVDSATPLESYGNGASTSFFTTKGNFPFRGRGFLLASLTARSRPLAADGAMGGDSTSASTSGLTPAVYFHASASFPERNAAFPMSKLNTSGLPLGKVLIDGWILETLDPYSSTLNYPIPSTRCTHVVAIDYAGSLPLAVNALWNANLPRSILAVEEYVKSRGSLPSIRSPPSFMHVLGDGRDEDTGLVWGYDDDTSARSSTLISSSFSPADRALSVLVHIDSEDGRRRQLEESKGLPSLPFPSRQAALSNASTTKGAAQAAVAALPGMHEFGASATSLASSSSDMSRATSMSSMRSTSSLVTPTASVMRTARPSAIRAEVRKPRDMTLVDVEVELRHYAAGYDIVVTSELDGSGASAETEDDTPHAEEPSTPVATEEGGATVIGSKAAICASPTSLSAPDVHQPLSLDAASKEASVLPCVVTSYDLPPSAVLAATLDPSARPRRHLVRIALPTSTFLEAHKGLMGGSIPADAPQWYKDLRFRGASLRVSIRPRDATPAKAAPASGTATPTMPSYADIDSQQVPAYYGGKRLDVVHVNQTSAMLQRESERKERYARLERIPAPPRVKAEAGAESAEQLLDDRLPKELQHAVAAALQLKADPATLNLSIDTAATAASADAADAATSEPPTPVAKSTRAKAPAEPTSTSAQLMSILNSYPLTRGLGAGTAVTATHANGGIVTNRGGAGSVKGEGSTNGPEGDGKGEAASQTGMAGSMPGSMAAVSANANATATAAVRALNVKNFSLATLILVALASFLLGSLVRGLTSPADFVLVPSSPSAAGGSAGDAALFEVRRMLQGWEGQPSGDVAWRELRRLVEIKRIIAGWDLVVAIAHR